MSNTCPISVYPRQILGYVNSRPVFAIAGASPEGDDAAAQAAAAAAAADAAAKAAADTVAAEAAAKAAADAKGAPAAWDGKIESLDPAVQKLITDARADAGKARTNAKETAAAEAREELLKKLGLTKDGEEIKDADQLAAQLASKDAQLLQLQRESAAGVAARTVGADVDAMLDSRNFVTKLAALDPASKSFDDDVKSLVETTLKENPKFKQAQAAGVSGGQFAGGSGEGKQRPTSLGAALTAATRP